jgi:hypothetical protein
MAMTMRQKDRVTAAVQRRQKWIATTSQWQQLPSPHSLRRLCTCRPRPQSRRPRPTVALSVTEHLKSKELSYWTDSKDLGVAALLGDCELWPTCTGGHLLYSQKARFWRTHWPQLERGITCSARDVTKEQAKVAHGGNHVRAADLPCNTRLLVLSYCGQHWRAQNLLSATRNFDIASWRNSNHVKRRSKKKKNRKPQPSNAQTFQDSLLSCSRSLEFLLKFRITQFFLDGLWTWICNRMWVKEQQESSKSWKVWAPTGWNYWLFCFLFLSLRLTQLLFRFIVSVWNVVEFPFSAHFVTILNPIFLSVANCLSGCSTFDLNAFNYTQNCTVQLRGKWGLASSQNGHLDLDAFHDTKNGKKFQPSEARNFQDSLLFCCPIMWKKAIRIYFKISDNTVFPSLSSDSSFPLLWTRICHMMWVKEGKDRSGSWKVWASDGWYHCCFLLFMLLRSTQLPSCFIVTVMKVVESPFSAHFVTILNPVVLSVAQCISGRS